MPFFIKEGDITKENTDAIVNAANNSLLGGGGVDGAIHRVAGPELLSECRTLGGCETGDAKITDAYNLPSKKIIHTVGPIWYGGNNNEAELLKSCYERSLELAKENNLKSIAFPLISSGIYGYPKEQALDIAVEIIQDFLKDNEMDVYLMIYDRSLFDFDQNISRKLDEYINDNYFAPVSQKGKMLNVSEQFDEVLYSPSKSSAFGGYSFEEELNDQIKNRGEGFSEMLLRKIDEAHLTDPECYKKANLDRRLFSKIKNNKNYNPSKETAIALALALELPIEETNELLEKAGYTLSDNILFDIIIRFYIENKIFNIYKVNEGLFAYNQKLLGS